MIQQQFAERVTEIVKKDDTVAGLAVGGSWITNELDEYSDLDLILVTTELISADKNKMTAYASRFGKLLTGFTGEHVGEPRVLICLYDDPLLHVDIKFLTLAEFHSRVETPFILFDRNGALKKVLETSESRFPHPDYQWIEDRFWIWIHYATLKIGRGEYFEAMDFLGFLRMVVLGPLLLIKNGHLPKGVRKIETQIDQPELEQLKLTAAEYKRDSIIHSLQAAVKLYQQLRKELYSKEIKLQTKTEERVLQYLTGII